MFKTRGGGGKGRLNNVKKTDDLVPEGVPKVNEILVFTMTSLDQQKSSQIFTTTKTCFGDGWVHP